MRPIDADTFNNFDYSSFDGALTEDAVQGMEAVLTVVDKAPTLDAVPVVRCKDCERYSGDGDFGVCHYWQYYCDAPEVNADDFCSHGAKIEVKNEQTD